jgi:hypothetical protein
MSMAFPMHILEDENRMWPRMRHKRSRRQRFRWIPVLLGTIGGTIVSLSLPQSAPADYIQGRVALTYTHSDTRDQSLTQPLQPAEDSESRTFVQQYTLNLEKNLYPNLRLFASGLFQKSDFAGIHNEERTDTTQILTRPYVDLTLRTSLYTIGANYNSAITETKTGTGPSVTMITDAYTGILGWRPVELPTAYLTVSRSHTYDREYAFRDTVADNMMFSSTYDPVTSVQLRIRIPGSSG